MLILNDRRHLGVVSLIFSAMFLLCTVAVVEMTDIFTLLTNYSVVLVFSIAMSYVAGIVSIYQSIRIFESTRLVELGTVIMFLCATAIVGFLQMGIFTEIGF